MRGGAYSKISLAYIIEAAPPPAFEMILLFACLNTASGSSNSLKFHSHMSILSGGLPLSPTDPNHYLELDQLPASLEKCLAVGDIKMIASQAPRSIELASLSQVGQPLLYATNVPSMLRHSRKRLPSPRWSKRTDRNSLQALMLQGVYSLYLFLPLCFLVQRY